MKRSRKAAKPRRIDLRGPVCLECGQVDCEGHEPVQVTEEVQPVEEPSEEREE